MTMLKKRAWPTTISCLSFDNKANEACLLPITFPSLLLLSLCLPLPLSLPSLCFSDLFHDKLSDGRSYTHPTTRSG
jgi:hypothetical protein